MATKRRYAIIRFSNWYDGEANAKVHMDFYGERNAMSEWQVFVTDEQSQDEALYLLMDIHEGEVLASYNSKVKA
tara:strand:- start:1213 stop:1434 length:222 start_codon:yes stop_codon:yes gene_type:complete